MKVFVSWSGGKDCTLALHRFMLSGRGEVACLLNMCEPDGEHSRSHGLKSDLLKAQAAQMNLPLVQQTIDASGYEANFKAVVNQLKNEGIKAGVFGDIYLMEHRTWIERRFDFNQHMGFYLHRPESVNFNLYQRYALYYKLKSHLKLGFSLKAHGHRAENIDVRVGRQW